VTMAKSDAILSRAVMFGLNIIMDDASVNKIITAIKAGVKAVPNSVSRLQWTWKMQAKTV